MQPSSRQCSSSAVRWSGAAVEDTGIAFERLSLFDCTSRRTWSAWADSDGNLVQGFVAEKELGGEHEFVLPAALSNVVGNADGGDSDKGFTRFIGPLLAMVLCSLSFVWLYRRRNIKRAPGDVDIPLAEHPKIPLSARIGVPIVLFTNLSLFSYSNATIGARVTCGFDIFQNTLGELTLFDFSLTNTVTDMWKAGVYPLSMLVALWSGIFPYLKLVLMLAAWFISPRYFLPIHRRRMLLMLDILGKWALLDLFLMNMMSIAFRFEIHLATIRYIPKELITVNVKVTSQFGLYVFVTAVALSLVSNHVVLAFHRNVASADDVDDGRRGISLVVSPSRVPLIETMREDVESCDDDEPIQLPRYCIHFPKGSWFDAGTQEAIATNTQPALRLALAKKSLMDHRFSVGTLPNVFLDSRTRSFRLSLKIFLILFSLLTLCLIVVCSYEDTFEFVFSGLAGKIIKVIDPEQQQRRASLLSIANDLGKDKEKSHVFGVVYLQSLYLLFALVFPLVVLIMATLMMFVRFNLRESKILFYALEVATAWSALDVFIIALIASIAQINQFSHFLVGDYCDPLDTYFGIKECFGVQTQLLKGCWLIVAASACFWCLIQFVQRTAERAIADREEVILELIHQQTSGQID